MPLQIPNHQHEDLTTRRSILIGTAVSLICAPAIVAVSNLMPVRRLPSPFGPQYAGFVERVLYQALANNLRVGRMTTVLNDKVIPEAAARQMVARAQDYGWLPPYISRYRKD